MKSTRQRDLIVDAFFQQEGHVNIDRLLELARSQDEHIAIATVYRTMKLLTECGLAVVRRFEDGQPLYERTMDRHHHDHLICKGCSAIVEFQEEAIEELQQSVAKLHGFLVTHHKLEMYGLCGACQASGATAESEQIDGSGIH